MGNIPIDVRKKIDKLLALSHSENVNEARVALEKSRDLLDKYYHLTPDNKNLTTVVFNRKVNLGTPWGRRAATILRHCEILEDCLDLIYNSEVLETVLYRISLAEQEFSYLLKLHDSDLRALKLKNHAQLVSEYRYFKENEPILINAAIGRAGKKVIAHANTLKTDVGRFKHIANFLEKSMDLPGLYPENIEAIRSLYADLLSDFGINL